jgi:hypothetical protein
MIVEDVALPGNKNHDITKIDAREVTKKRVRATDNVTSFLDV